MHLDLNKYQRAALLLAAAIIVFVQFAQFSDNGVKGSGWVFSFLTAGVLVVVALAARRPVGVSTSRPETVAMPGKIELETTHAVLRENAEILTVEVEERASNLANALREQTDKAKTAVVSVMPEMGAFADALESTVHERCISLMLGLVGMRRSKGNQLYITSLEFKTLQEQIGKTLIRVAVAAQTSIPLGPEVNTGALAKVLLNELLEVRKTITKYCLALESKQLEPEAALLEWFKSKTSLDVRQHTLVRGALRQGRE
jgi:hypothetical protein